MTNISHFLKFCLSCVCISIFSAANGAGYPIYTIPNEAKLPPAKAKVLAREFARKMSESLPMMVAGGYMMNAFRYDITKNEFIVSMDMLPNNIPPSEAEKLALELVPQTERERQIASNSAATLMGQTYCDRENKFAELFRAFLNAGVNIRYRMYARKHWIGDAVVTRNTLCLR